MCRVSRRARVGAGTPGEPRVGAGRAPRAHHAQLRHGAERARTDMVGCVRGRDRCLGTGHRDHVRPGPGTARGSSWLRVRGRGRRDLVERGRAARGRSGSRRAERRSPPPTARRAHGRVRGRLRMKTHVRLLLIGTLMASGFLPAALEAQAGGPGRRGDGNRAQLEERVRAQMGRVMREGLGLDEEQATRLSAVVQDFDGQRRELFALEQATRRRVEALLLEGGNDQDEARELIGRMGELREQEAEVFRSEQAALLEVLTPVQVLRLQELRQDLGQRIRALGGRNGAPGGGPGPGRGGRSGGTPGL
ncbi:MAG: hypothetical protein EXR91_09320 [Gemmatimonadetes bacterium]|nr:hypothetical protein [Gemmatimonadota bacterium]